MPLFDVHVQITPVNIRCILMRLFMNCRILDLFPDASRLEGRVAALPNGLNRSHSVQMGW